MAQVGCAGILVADTFCGPMQHLPQEGQLITVDAFKSQAGGCAANVAIDLVKQKVRVDVAGCVGTDTQATIVLKELKDHGVGCDRVISTNLEPTSQTVILVVDGQDRRFIHNFGANSQFAVSRIDRQWLADLNVFYFGGLFAMPGIDPDELVELLQLCRANQIITVVDVVVPPAFQSEIALKKILCHIDWFLPNDDESRQLAGRDEPQEQIRWFMDQGAQSVIITQGIKGLLAAQGADCWQSDTFMTDVIDPSGSGDAFAAGVIAGIIQKRSLPDILQYASALGASSTRCVGCTDGVYTADEADAFLGSHSLNIKHQHIES